jgi:autotransporter-associated beta strand protein
MALHSSTWRHARTALSILLAAASLTPAARGQQYTFVQDTDNTGTWSDPAQWTGGPPGTFPNGADVKVLINAPTRSGGSGAYNLTLPATDVTVGEIKVDNTNYANTYRSNFANSGGHLIFESTSGPAKYTETIGSAPGTTNSQYQFLMPVDLHSDLVFTQDNYPNLNTGTTFSNLVTGASNLTLTKAGHGGLQFNYNHLPAETPFQGHVVINQGGIRLISINPFINVSDITVNSGGQLMLADNGNNASNADWNLGAGVLTLNGAGKATDSPQSVSNPDGALRFALGQISSSTLHNPVTLQSTSVISVVSNSGTPGNLTGTIDSVISGPGGLTKHGAGTLILSNAANSYSGNTKLLAGGPLSITNPFLADGADVYVNTGATFDLSFSATDTIRSLFFNDGVNGDMAQTPGKYGAVGNGSADFQVSWITGAGLLNVSTLPVIANADFNGDGKVDGADFLVW